MLFSPPLFQSHHQADALTCNSTLQELLDRYRSLVFGYYLHLILNAYEFHRPQTSLPLSTWNLLPVSLSLDRLPIWTLWGSHYIIVRLDLGDSIRLRTIPHLWLARKPLVPHQRFLLSLLFFPTTCPVLSRSHRLCLSASKLLLIAAMFSSLRRCYWITFFPCFFSESVLNPWSSLLLVHLDEYIACFPSETYAC